MGFVEVGRDGHGGIRFEKKMPESSKLSEPFLGLKSLTKEYIEKFAPPKIFGRGVDYSSNRRIISLEYDPDEDSITAEVEGNYGNYLVEISAREHEINAYCDCPYEGYPCKHVIAVLLSFVKERSRDEKSTEQVEHRR